MSVNRLISIHNPIIDAMNLCNIDHDKDIPFFTRLAILAEKEIGSTYGYVTKREVLTISNCVACLPNDAEYVEIAILGDLGCDCEDLNTIVCGTGINLESTTGTVYNTFLVVDIGDGSEGGTIGYVDFSIQNNKMVFGSNRDGQKITVQYQTPAVDCDGFVEVSQNHIQAIKWYIVWMYYFRKTGINSLEYGKMNTAFEEWKRECSHARAQDAELTPTQRLNLRRMYNNPYAGDSLSDGMRTTLGGNW